MKNKIGRFFFGHDNPNNLYEECPVLAWVILICFVTYGLWGFFVVYKF